MKYFVTGVIIKLYGFICVVYRIPKVRPDLHCRQEASTDLFVY